MPFEIVEELQVELKNKPGALGDVLKVLAKGGAEVRAFCGYAMGKTGYAMLVPRDAKKAKAVLKKAKLKFGTGQVVVCTVKDRCGAGADIAGRAAAQGINLDYAYASGTGKGMGVMVLAAGKGTAKLAKALK